MDRTIHNTTIDMNSCGTARLRRRLVKLARAAVAGLRQWTKDGAHYPTGPGFRAEALEERQLFTFDLTVAGPPSATAGVQFYIYAWTSGGTMSGDYSVNFNDGTGTHTFVPSGGRVTAIPYTYNSLTDYQINVTANSCTQSLGLDDVGNYPGGNAGPTTYLPGSATSSSAGDVVVDGGTGDTYVAESYYTSGGGYQMALTRLDSSDNPDTTFGTYVSGTTYTGTYLVSSFGGGLDIPYAAAVLDADSVDYVALAGHSANGMAVAIIDVSGAGSTVATSDYGSQTMPAGTAYAVTFDSSNDVVAAGTNSTATAFVAVALYGITGGGDNAGELDTSFDTTGVTSCDIGGTDNGAEALAIMQEPDTGGGNGDLVLGGWYSGGCTGCYSCGSCTYSCCSMLVLGLQDTEGSPNRGQVDTSGFGFVVSGSTHSGYDGAEVSNVAATADFNGCRGNGTLSNDSVYSLAWDDETYSIFAIGGTNYSGANQFAIWDLNLGGNTDTGWGASGLAVPDVNATAAGGTVDTWEGNGSGVAPDGYLWLVGTMNSDMFIGRTDTNGVLDTTFGQVTSSTSTADVGYFTQDLGTASANSSDTGHAMAVEGDGSVVIVGNTTGGKIAVARYLENDSINVGSEGEGRPFVSLAAVQAASVPAATFSSGPAITPDTTAGDLSPPDGSGGQDPLHKRSSRRPAILLGASPPVSPVPLASSP